MRKIISIVLAAALVLALCVFPASADSNIIDADEANIVNANLDDFLWTYYAGSGPLSAAGSGVTDIRAWMDAFIAQGGLGVSVAQIGTSFDKIIMRGWIGFDQEIEMFGYQINDETPVFEPFNATFV